MVLNKTNEPNPIGRSGLYRAQVDDIWLGSRGNKWDGQSIRFPYYWVITRNDVPLDNRAIPQATFTAVREYFVLVRNVWTDFDDAVQKRRSRIPSSRPCLPHRRPPPRRPPRPPRRHHQRRPCQRRSRRPLPGHCPRQQAAPLASPAPVLAHQPERGTVRAAPRAQQAAPVRCRRAAEALRSRNGRSQ